MGSGLWRFCFLGDEDELRYVGVYGPSVRDKASTVPLGV